MGGGEREGWAAIEGEQREPPKEGFQGMWGAEVLETETSVGNETEITESARCWVGPVNVGPSD